MLRCPILAQKCKIFFVMVQCSRIMVVRKLIHCDCDNRSIPMGCTRPRKNTRALRKKGKTMSTKATYERPTFKKVGSIEAITKSTSNGNRTDAAYAAQAPLITGALS